MNATPQNSNNDQSVPLQIIVVIDHHTARLFPVGPNTTGSTQPLELTPHDPHGFHRHLIHRKEANYEGERVPEDPVFYEQIATALIPAHEILIIGHGTGKSSAGHHLLEQLKKRHAAIAARVVDTITADLSHLTDGQLVALGRPVLAKADARRRHEIKL